MIEGRQGGVMDTINRLLSEGRIAQDFIGIGYKDQERKPFDESHLQWEKIHLGTFRMPTENKQEEA